jgi:peptidoglycan/LPS O-acetylase OafA/YrhL
VIILVFPLIIAIGAGNRQVTGVEERVCRFLGAISYPIYITHYPLIYIYTAWASRAKQPLPQAILYGVLLYVSAIVIAWACLKLYDEPVRRWLTARFLGRPSAPISAPTEVLLR